MMLVPYVVHVRSNELGIVSAHCTGTSRDARSRRVNVVRIIHCEGGEALDCKQLAVRQ